MTYSVLNIFHDSSIFMMSFKTLADLGANFSNLDIVADGRFVH